MEKNNDLTSSAAGVDEELVMSPNAQSVIEQEKL